MSDPIRTCFHSSSLIRLLADLSILDADGSRQDVAERLAQWVGVGDALALVAVHNAAATKRSDAKLPLCHDGLSAVEEEFRRVRNALVKSITESCSDKVGANRMSFPVPKPGTSADAAYQPYLRFYQAHQRAIESSIGPLRVNAREVLARASPALRQLAMLDAAFETILDTRERTTLATLPSLLEKRFEQLLKADQQTPVDPGHAQDDAVSMRAGAWLARFTEEVKLTLLAELDVRLQPVAGLIEAFANEANQHK